MLRLAVVDASEKRGEAVRMANPEVLHASVKLRGHDEASPNLPGVFAKIERPRAVTVRFLNDQGEIEERVAEYLPKLKEIQPEGPYRLAGWSLGGAFAYGLARALEDEGKEVAYVGLLDVVAPKVPLTDEPAEKKARLERWEKFARKNYDIGDEIELPMDRLNAADDEGQFRIIMELVQLSDKKIPTSMIEHQRTSYLDNRALDTIEIQPYDGHVTLYMADRYHDDAIFFEPRYAIRQPDGGWGEFVEDLEIVPIGGEHIQAIDEPYIAKVGAHMSQAINAIEAESESK